MVKPTAATAPPPPRGDRTAHDCVRTFALPRHGPPRRSARHPPCRAAGPAVPGTRANAGARSLDRAPAPRTHAPETAPGISTGRGLPWPALRAGARRAARSRAWPDKARAGFMVAAGDRTPAPAPGPHPGTPPAFPAPGNLPHASPAGGNTPCPHLCGSRAPGPGDDEIHRRPRRFPAAGAAGHGLPAAAMPGPPPGRGRNAKGASALRRPAASAGASPASILRSGCG